MDPSVGVTWRNHGTGLDVARMGRTPTRVCPIMQVRWPTACDSRAPARVRELEFVCYLLGGLAVRVGRQVLVAAVKRRTRGTGGYVSEAGT